MTGDSDNTLVHLSLGSNEGKRMDFIQMARYFIQNKLGKIIKQSNIYEAESWGVDNQDLYLNQVILIETTMAPKTLLDEIHLIESKLGRKRNFHWSSRTIDIDILTFGSLIIQDEDLVIPHLFMAERKFVLLPICDISPNEKHPRLGYTYKELLLNCKDEKRVSLHHEV